MSKTAEIEVRFFDHGKNKVDLTHLGLIEKIGYWVKQARIDEIHHKSDGSVTNRPVIYFVSSVPHEGKVINGLSLDTLDKALQCFGYKIVRTKL